MNHGFILPFLSSEIFNGLLSLVLLNPKSPAWPHIPLHFPPSTNSSTRWSPTLTVHTQLHLQVHRDSPAVPSFLSSVKILDLLSPTSDFPSSCHHIPPGPHWPLCQMMQPWHRRSRIATLSPRLSIK